MHIKSLLAVLFLTPAFVSPGANAEGEFTGRFSMLGATSQATQGDAGYVSNDKTLSADQQSLRLMLDGAGENNEWSAHVKVTRQVLTGIPFNGTHSSNLFRANLYSDFWVNETSTSHSVHAGYQLDRAFYQHRNNNINFSIGRQPLDWGSGRFWQPLNIFGAFAPTDLDTDFKPGIDIAKLKWFPGDFSSLTAVYVFSPTDHSVVKNKQSAAIYYRQQVGNESSLLLLAGSVIGHTLTGAAFESTLGDFAYRIEATNMHEYDTGNNSLFWIAGLDYQFNNGAFFSAELYNNSRGAANVSEITALQNDSLVKYGLQPQLGPRVLGLSISNDLSSLFNGRYTLLLASLNEGASSPSILNQFTLTYSVSNESDLLLSLLTASGEGLTGTVPRSEYGHIPTTFTARLRFYF